MWATAHALAMVLWASVQNLVLNCKTYSAELLYCTYVDAVLLATAENQTKILFKQFTRKLVLNNGAQRRFWCMPWGMYSIHFKACQVL